MRRKSEEDLVICLRKNRGTDDKYNGENQEREQVYTRGLTVPETRSSHGSSNRFLHGPKREKTRDKGHSKYSHVFLGMSLAIILLFVGVGVASAADYYVATWGNNGNSGTSLSEAWQLPSYAAQQVQAGDTIYLVDGTWSDEHVVFTASGTASDPITLTAYNGTPTLDGCDDTGKGIHLKTSNYVKISGNLLVKNYEDGIYVEGGYHHIDISDLEITSLSGWGIYVRPSCHDITVDKATITHTDGGAFITHLAGHTECEISDIVIKNCIMVDNNHDAINIFGNTKNVLIEDNSITDASNGAGIMVHDFGNENITIRANTIVDSTRGIQLIGVDGCLIEDNIISNSYSTQGILFLVYTDPEDTISNVTVKNNIIRDSASEGIQLYISSSRQAAGKEIKDNIFINNSMEKRFSFIGTNIYTTTIRNIADSSRVINIDDTLSDLEIEFTDGRTFKLNGGAGGHTSATLTEAGTYTIEVEGDITIPVPADPDTVPPIITAHSPMGSSVSVAELITVTFNEAMNTLSAENAFSISPSISGAFSWDGDKMVFTPDSHRDYETTYTVTIATEAEDLAGNNLLSPFSWQFTTRNISMNPVGEWHFNEGSGGIAVDSSGNGNNGTVHSASWTAGKLETALKFDGINDYISIPNSQSLNPSDEITLTAWVKPHVIPQTGYRKIIAKPYTSYSSPWQQYALTLQDNQFVFELNTEGAKEILTGTVTLEPNTWYHVAGTYDGSEMKIYVNGMLNGTLPKSGMIAGYPTDVHIGAGIYCDENLEYINGTLDELKIYNRELSAEEIEEDYEAGLADNTSPPTTTYVITPTPTEAGWNNVSPVVITFFRYDDLGLAYTNYSKISALGPWTRVCTTTAIGSDAGNVSDIHADTFNVSVSQEGITNLWYYTTNNNGTSEKVKNMAVKIDAADDDPKSLKWWGYYDGCGDGTWGRTTSEAHTGDYSVFLKGTAYEADFMNIGLIAGDSNGYSGADAYTAIPSTTYDLSFWLKGNFTRIGVQALTWNTDEGSSSDRQWVSTTLGYLTPTDTWTKYEGTFTTPADAKKFVLMFKAYGDSTEENLGTIYVDDVNVNVGGDNLLNNPGAENAAATSTLPTASTFGVADTSGQKSTYVDVPVTITNVQNGPITSVRFDLYYDTSVITVVDAQNGALTALWDRPATNTFAWGTRVSLVYDGELAHALQNGSTGSVALLNLSVLGEPGETSTMNLVDIQLADEAYNVGTAPAENGTFTVLAASSLIGCVSDNIGVPMEGVTVNLTLTTNSSVHRTTTTNETGYYSFNGVNSGEYYVNSTKLRYWQNSSTITIGAGEAENRNNILWLKGDLNDNGIAADAGDQAMIKDASVGTITADWKYDLNRNGIFADAGDQAMIKDASVGTIELL